MRWTSGIAVVRQWVGATSNKVGVFELNEALVHEPMDSPNPWRPDHETAHRRELVDNAVRAMRSPVSDTLWDLTFW
jgi:hypothetical protein